MTIEGRPEIKVSEDYWEKEYARQRKDRMQDAIDDYLQDEKVDPRQAYEEILCCIQDVISHHKKNLKKSEELRDLMLGYRPVDLNLPERY
jgi:predicted house-cleaning noncanonical NTP pyrophosphatase (MazG superfamily)